MAPKILISFDVEEFDMPLEYQTELSVSEQMQVGYDGLKVILPIVEKHMAPCTFFTTAHFALHFPQAVKQIAIRHEIASHTYYHSAFENEHLSLSKQVLENISGQVIYGLRMPRMRKVDMKEVQKAGYLYDSSINPTLLPGRYNHLSISRTIYWEENILRLPASVSPYFRIPLFWLGFKNYPYHFFMSLCKKTLRKDGYLCLYFHPWEFTPIDNYGLPKYTCRPNGIALQKRLQRLLTDLKPYGEYCTIKDFLIEKNIVPT